MAFAQGGQVIKHPVYDGKLKEFLCKDLIPPKFIERPTNMITPEQLKEWRQIAEKATPGPYDVERIDHDNGEIAYEINDAHQLVAFYESNFELPLKAKFNAEFYCCARNTYIQLLDEIDRLRGALESATHPPKRS